MTQQNAKPVSFEQTIEDEIKKKGLNAPRVTKEQVDALFNQLQFTLGRVGPTRIMCSASLDGFSIADGFSAVVSPENFDEELGTKIAHKKCALKAYDRLWELEGYRLSRERSEAKADPKSILT